MMVPLLCYIPLLYFSTSQLALRSGLRSTQQIVSTAATLGVNYPPIGAVYKKTLSFPLIGDQVVQVKINSNTVASLSMFGVIKYNNNINYSYNSKKELNFIIPNDLKRILDKYKIKFSDIEYNHLADNALITLSIPLIGSKRVQINRSQRDR